MSQSEKELAKTRRLLADKRSALLKSKETGAEAAGIVELDQTRVGRLSRMDALQAQAMSQETNRRREIELQRIELAIQRLNNGEYGFCIKCEEEISPLRLEVDPTAPLCIDCASL